MNRRLGLSKATEEPLGRSFLGMSMTGSSSSTGLVVVVVVMVVVLEEAPRFRLLLTGFSTSTHFRLGRRRLLPSLLLLGAVGLLAVLLVEGRISEGETVCTPVKRYRMP